MFDLTQKDSAWWWGEAEKSAFEAILAHVISAPILVFLDETRPFRVEADSSDFTTGAVLSQQSPEDDKWHPVAYYSKSINAVEQNYKIHDKEMLAVIQALEDWRHSLEGAHHKFEIWTDHKNLEYFMTAKKLNRHQARWSLYLSRFDFAMHHRPGHSMGKSDALSRRADHGTRAGDNSDVMLLCSSCDPSSFRTVFGRRRARHPSGYSQGKPRGQTRGRSRELRKSKGKSVRASEWSEHDELLCFQDQIYVPNDPELRRRITSQHHDTRVAGHLGRWKTLELVSRNYWWPQMSCYIGRYVKTCDPCLRTKIQRRCPTGELHPLPTPESRWDVISVDFIVELPDSHGYDAVMNVVDSVGKRAHFIPTNTTITALGAARLFLHNVWKLHRLPRRIVSDRGLQFMAEFTRELYRLLGITLSTTTAYHPQADRQMECVNQELEQYLRVFVNERQDDWDELLPMAEFQYNNHIHSGTQQTPFLLDIGWHRHMGFEPTQSSSHLETVNEFTDPMQSTLTEAKSVLAKA
jgi:transposase InsO family protein